MLDWTLENDIFSEPYLNSKTIKVSLHSAGGMKNDTQRPFSRKKSSRFFAFRLLAAFASDIVSPLFPAFSSNLALDIVKKK